MTVKGQRNVFEAARYPRRTTIAEEVLEGIVAELPKKAKPAQLDCRALATEGSVERLHELHRGFSGLSTHVTGDHEDLHMARH